MDNQTLDIVNGKAVKDLSKDELVTIDAKEIPYLPKIDQNDVPPMPDIQLTKVNDSSETPIIKRFREVEKELNEILRVCREDLKAKIVISYQCNDDGWTEHRHTVSNKISFELWRQF